jgi:hypothetical protein
MYTAWAETVYGSSGMNVHTDSNLCIVSTTSDQNIKET